MTAPPAIITTWLTELSTQRRQSEHTITAYRHELERLKTLSGETTLESLQAHHLRRFIAQLHSQGLSARSLARTLSAWRSFYRWLIQQDIIQNNPAAAIRPAQTDDGAARRYRRRPLRRRPAR